MMTSPLAAKKIQLNLIDLQNYNILDQLRLEEALLRADKENWCLINCGTPSAIVMGISGKSEQLIDQKKLQEKPVPVIRRFSGGGTVFVDLDTIFITWICNTADCLVDCCPIKLHTWTANFYQETWSEINMQLFENDYVIGTRKFGGNAQYLCKGRWLHHSSLLWDFDPINMEYLHLPEKAPQYRQKRNHNDFLCKLKGHFSCKAHFKERLLGSLHENFAVNIVNVTEAQEIKNRPHRQATELFEASAASFGVR